MVAAIPRVKVRCALELWTGAKGSLLAAVPTAPVPCWCRELTEMNLKRPFTWKLHGAQHQGAGRVPDAFDLTFDYAGLLAWRHPAAVCPGRQHHGLMRFAACQLMAEIAVEVAHALER